MEPILTKYGVVEMPKKDYPPRWNECEDIRVLDDAATVLYAGPRYLRCKIIECRQLVTHGMIAQGGCWCGNRRLEVCHRLSVAEQALLKRGYYPLLPWEVEAIQSVLPEGKAIGWGAKRE